MPRSIYRFMTMNQALVNETYLDRFEAKFENVGNVVSSAQDYLLSMEVSQDVTSLCMLALGEVLNNIVEHSYENRIDGEAELRILICEKKVAFQVKDWGIAPPDNIFSNVDSMPDPSDLPEGGWGLALIVTLMDDISYRSENGENLLDLAMNF